MLAQLILHLAGKLWIGATTPEPKNAHEMGGKAKPEFAEGKSAIAFEEAFATTACRPALQEITGSLQVGQTTTSKWQTVHQNMRRQICLSSFIQYTVGGVRLGAAIHIRHTRNC